MQSEQVDKNNTIRIGAKGQEEFIQTVIIDWNADVISLIIFSSEMMDYFAVSILQDHHLSSSIYV
jgi:hypothetical protein